jgi:arsenite methyltransferase
MSAEQLAKADRLRSGATNMRFVPGRLEALPVPDRSFDAVISNGVFNLCPDKAQVFREAARVLRPGGRLAAADIVASQALPDSVTFNADLWSACIGGAAPSGDYIRWLAAAGLAAGEFHDVPQYHFLSPQAANASDTYGVRAVTYAAHRAR